jgi:glycosyltransferase involved in cell wall biosynthesis
MSLCINYARPASGNDGEVFGLDVAVTNLLSAYFRHSTSHQFICRPVDIPSFDHFKSLAAATGHGPDTTCVGLDPRTPRQNLESISVMFRPDPLIADLAWRRHQLKGRGYATCGLVHTMSGERIARAVGDLLLAPTDGSDTLICPSEAVRDAVQNLWSIHADYYSHRFGTPILKCPVQTPVIPLGIDTQKFHRLTTDDKRAAQRLALNAPEGELIILFVGRLSFATKAHPLAMWQAAEGAAAATRRKVRVIMFGYFKPKDMDKHFRDLAAATARHTTIEFVMNDDPRFPDGLWAAADIFMSLSDNVQESFGLTPIEAMASGLPSVISDWDGYRGSIRNNIDGYLIPTVAPPAAAGQDIAELYFNENNYGAALVGASQSTAIDINACATALTELIRSESKRKEFGTNARNRAEHVFDWKHIIKAYEDLWHDLAAKRQSLSARSGVPSHWPAAHPGYINPWAMFDSFPTATLQPRDRLRIIMTNDEISKIIRHDMNIFIPELLAPKETLIELIELIRKAGTPFIQDILEPFPNDEHNRLWRCLGWMLKFGIAVIERRTL